MLKSIYALQPYQVGSKHGKSLVICIPSRVAKEYNISTSTVFALQADEKTKRIRLQTLGGLTDEKMNPSGESLATNKQPDCCRRSQLISYDGSSS